MPFAVIPAIARVFNRMRDPLHDTARDPAIDRRARIPFIWIAVALSMLMHATALWFRLPEKPIEPSIPPGSPLHLRILPSPAVPPVPLQRAPPRALAPAPPAVAQRPRAPARPLMPQRLTPPVIALERPAPATPTAPPAAPPSLPPAPASEARPPPVSDFSASLEARRRARGESAQDAAASRDRADEKARQDQIVAANLEPNRPAFGFDPAKQEGGIFQIKRLGVDDAEFYFYGWSKEARRNTAQVVDVRKGANADIRIAIIRSMIAIIRDHEQGEFTWDSRRLGRSLRLSARPADSAGLEEVLMREFFDPPRPSAR